MAAGLQLIQVALALLLLISTVPAEVVPPSEQCAVTACTDATRFVYEPGQTYIYDYEARITTNLDGSTDQSAGYFLQSTVHFQILSPCELAMTMHNTKLFEVYDAADDQHDLSSRQAFQVSLEEQPLRFSFHDGRIEAVCSAVAQPAWVLNVKKGILSLFQSSLNTSERRRQKINEVDVLGTCDTEYIQTQGWRATVVKKSKTLDTCNDHQWTISAIQANPFMAGASHSLPLIHGTQECEQTITHALLEKVECYEEHHLRPFSGPDGGGVVTRIQQSLTFTADIDGTTVKKNDITMRTTLLFQPTFVDSASKEKHRPANAQQAMQQLCENAKDDVQEDTPSHFNVLVEKLQVLDATSIQHLVDNVSSICKLQAEKGRKFLLDGLVQTSTPAAHHVMTHLVSHNLVTDTVADWWFFNLGLQPNPTEASLSAVAPLLELPHVLVSAYLGISSLVATYCRTWPSCESSAQVLRIINRLESNLGNSCETNNEHQLSKVILSLKALGNIGLPQRSHPVLHMCVHNHLLPTELRIAAIQAHRRFSCNMVRSSLLDAFLETEEDSELRIALYIEVMRCPTKEVIDAIHNALNVETVNQVGSFVWTHLTNLQESADLCKADIQGLLADHHLQVKFSTDARKFSRAYEWSFFSEALDAGAHIDGSLVFSPESYLPRSGMLNLTVDLFGRSVNMLELSGRMEGFEDSIDSLFGPTGVFSSRPLKSAVRATRDKWNIDQQKLKQLSDKAQLHNNPDRKPRASAALKIFGNELKSWSLYGMQQLSVLHNTWNLQSLLMRLATDHQIETTHSAVLLKSQAVLSTGAGLSLRLTINSTATATLSAAGHIDLRRLASRSVEIVGHLNPSGAIHVTGLMGVDGIISHAGMELKTSLHSSTCLDGQVEIRAKELVRIRVNMPKERVQLIKLKNQLFVTQSQWRHAIAGVLQDRLDASHCTGNLTSRTFGIELCGHLNYPNASGKVEAPYFPLTGPAELQFYVRKTDPGLSSFLLEYRWEKDQITTVDGKQYQRNYLISLKTPHSLQDRELTAELIINEADHSLSCRLLSPLKKIIINGKYIYEADHKKMEATLSVDGRQYLVTTELKTDTTDITSRLTPRIHIRLPDGPVLSLTGFIFLQLGKKLTFDLRLDHLTTRPIVLVGEVVRSERQGFRRLDWDATFGSPTIEAHLQGYLQAGGGAWSATSGIEYWRPTERGGPPDKKHRIDFLAKFRNTSPPSRALTRLTATAELQMTAYPQYGIVLSWTFLNAVGHIENIFEVGLGPNARDQNYQLTLHQELSYVGHGTQDNNVTARFSVRYPIRGVYCVLWLHHRSTKHATTTEVELQLDPERTLALEASYYDESQSLAKIHGTVQLHLPTRTIRILMSLDEKKRHEYILESEAHWGSGNPLIIKGLYRNRSTRLQLAYDLEAIAQTPAGNNYSIQGHFLAAENLMSVGSRVETQEGQYLLKANLTRQRRGSYHLQTSAEWPGDFYKGTAKLTLGDEKVINIDAIFGEVRRIRGEAALQHFDDLQSCVVELLWDADRDTSKKITLDARHRQPSLGERKGEVYFTHPLRNVTFVGSSRTYGSWSHGPLSLTSEMVLDWGQRLTLSTEIQQITGPNRQDISVLASANTPFQGFEVLHASATHSSDEAEWATQAKIMGPAGKAVYLDSRTVQRVGSNTVETRLNLATPFEGFRNVTAHAWHRDDGADVALGMEGRWDNGKRILLKAYASDIGHLQEKEHDDEYREDNVNIRGGASISSPWTGIAGASFNHLVTAMLLDSKAEVHWGQQGTEDNENNHQHALDLKRLSVAMSSRSGKRGPNTDTEASAHIITPLEGFKRAGALFTHTTDYSGFQTTAKILWGPDGKSLDDALRIRVKGWHQSTATSTNVHAELLVAAPLVGFDEVGTHVRHIHDWNKLNTNVYVRWSPEGFFNTSVLCHNALDRIQAEIMAQLPGSGYQVVEGSFKHQMTSSSLNSSIRASARQGETIRNLGLTLWVLWFLHGINAHRIQGSVIVDTPTEVLHHFSLEGMQIKENEKLLTRGDIDINGNKAWLNHDLTFLNTWHLSSQFTAAVPLPFPCHVNVTHAHKEGHLSTYILGKWAQQEASATLQLHHEESNNKRLLRAAVTMDTPFYILNSVGATIEHTHVKRNRTLLVEVTKGEIGKSLYGWLYLSSEMIAGRAALFQSPHEPQNTVAIFSGEVGLNSNKSHLKLNIQFPMFAVEVINLTCLLERNQNGTQMLALSYKCAGSHGELKLSWVVSNPYGFVQLYIVSSIANMEHIDIVSEWQWPANNDCSFKTNVSAFSFNALTIITCIDDKCDLQLQASWEKSKLEDWQTIQMLKGNIKSTASDVLGNVRLETAAKGHQRMLMGQATIARSKEKMGTIPWHADITLSIQGCQPMLLENSTKSTTTAFEKWQFTSHLTRTDSVWEAHCNISYKDQSTTVTVTLRNESQKLQFIASLVAPFTPFNTASLAVSLIPNEQGVQTTALLTVGKDKHQATGQLISVGNDANYKARGNLNVESTSLSSETITVALTINGGGTHPLEAGLTISSPDHTIQVTGQFKNDGLQARALHLVIDVPAVLRDTFSLDVVFHKNASHSFYLSFDAGMSNQWFRFLTDFKRGKAWQTANFTMTCTMPIQNFDNLLFHIHYIFETWEHLEAGFDMMTPLNGYEKLHFLAHLKNMINQKTHLNAITLYNPRVKTENIAWHPEGNWEFSTELETSIDGWHKGNLVALRRLALDNTNYWQSDLQFRDLCWSAYGSAHISAFPNLSVDVHIVTPINTFDNLSLTLMQHLDKLSYHGKIDGQWLKDNKFGISGQFASSGVEVNISTSVATFSSARAFYEYHNTDDQLIAKVGATYNDHMIAGVDLHVVQDLESKWHSSIDLHNPWQPVGVGIGIEHDTHDSQYTSELCWNLNQKSTSTFSGKATIRQSTAGREFIMQTIHPQRVMKLQSRYLHTSMHFAHDAILQWDSSSASAIGYAISLDSKLPSASDHPVQYEAALVLTSPLRIVDAGGEVTISDTKFGGKASLMWDAGRDRSREASITFQLQVADNNESAYSGYIAIHHPQLQKDVALRGNVSYGIQKRELLSLLIEADYSPRLQHRLVFSTNVVNDANHRSNGGTVAATAKLLHPASGINIQLEGNATDSPFQSVAHVQLIYQDKYDTLKVCTMTGLLSKEDRYAQVQVRLPRDDWQTRASIKQHHTSHLAELSHYHNNDEQVFVEAKFDNNIPRVNLSIYHGQERNLMYSLMSGFQTSRHFVFEALRHQLTNDLRDAFMTLILPHPFLVDFHLKWKPTLMDELLNNANATARVIIEELKASWAHLRHYVRDEAITKRRRFLAATNNAWEDFMENVDEDLKFLHRDLELFLHNLEAMYEDDHFHARQVTEWLQDQGFDVGDLYQQLKEFMDALSKALLHELGIVTAAVIEAWEAGRDLCSGGVDDLLEFILTQGSTFGRSMQDAFQQLRRQIARSLRLLVDVLTRTCQMMVSSLSSVRQLLWKKLSNLWAGLKAWGQAAIQKWNQLKQKVMDFVYQVWSEFLRHPIYVNFITWIQSMYNALAEFWSKELYAALKRHLAIIWDALVDGQSSFIGFLIRQGRWLKEKAVQFGEQIQNNVHVVFYTNLAREIQQRVSWVLNYYQLCDDWTVFPLRIYQATSILTQRTGYQSGIQYDTRNRVIFSYLEGRVEIKQYLPMAWYALTRWPQVDQLPEVRLYSTLQNVMSGMGPSIWDTFYTYQPYLTSTSTWLPPFPGYAILAGKQHFVTFDKAFFAAAGECTYLLSHDIVEGNFTIAVKYDSKGAQPSLVLILGDREAEISASGKVTINGKKTELPQVANEQYIMRQGSLIVASPARGVLLECNLVFNYCQFRVDGWYFARTTGLFGSYNNEPSDDDIPNKDSASSMATWEIGADRCRSHHNRAITAPLAIHSSPICAYYFENRNSMYKHCFKQVDPRPYYQMCLNDIAESQPFHEETICTSTAAYVTACHTARVLLRTPRSCIQCSVSDNKTIAGGDNVTLYEGHVQASSDVVLIIEAKTCNQKVAPFIPELVKNIEDSLVQAGMVGNRYSVIGFGGNGVYDKPHTHTMDGDIFGNSKVVASALTNVAYGDGISDTFTALHFAANLPFRAGVSKTFIGILCTKCQQTSHWVGYQEVYRTLLEDGIHVHLLIDHEFSIRNTKDFYGMDGTHAYTVKDARTRNLRGDKDLRSRVVEPKYICIPPALESNGSVFSVRRLMDGKRRTKSFQDVFSRRVAKTASPTSCQRCDCVPDAFGAGKIHCQPCLYPGSTLLFSTDSYGLDEEIVNSEEYNSAETEISPLRQKTKGNRHNRKRKRSRAHKRQQPTSSNVTDSPL